MRVITRTAAAITSAAALLALVTGTALAGGWAEVTVAPASGGPPTAGEDREIQVTLLQHGVTPVDWGEVNLTGTNPATGESITVAATSVGNGEWIAAVTFPTDGTWEIAVSHSQLATSAVPEITVGAASPTWLPAAIAGAALAALMALGLAGVAVARAARPAGARPVHGVATRAEG